MVNDGFLGAGILIGGWLFGLLLTFVDVITSDEIVASSLFLLSDSFVKGLLSLFIELLLGNHINRVVWADRALVDIFKEGNIIVWDGDSDD